MADYIFLVEHITVNFDLFFTLEGRIVYSMERADFGLMAIS